MPRESQYIDDYLDTAADPATRWTPDTFLTRTLAGKAKDYSAGYRRALMRAIGRRQQAGTVIAVPSKSGGTAFMRAQDQQRNEQETGNHGTQQQ